MKKLDLYLTREYLRLFLLMLLSIICLYLIIDFFGKIRMFLSNNADPIHMVRYFLYTIPLIVSLTTPAVTLLTTLITFGNLSRHNEIVAMKANGISLYRTGVPILVIGGIITAFVFLFSEFITPYSNQQAEQVVYVDVQKQKNYGSFKQNQIWYRGKDGIYNIQLIDPATNTLQGITIHYLDPQTRLTSRIDADRAEWKDGRWLLHNVLVTRFDATGTPVLERRETLSLELPETPADFRRVQRSADQMGYLELRKYIARLQAEGYNADRYLVDLEGKIAFPFVTVLLVVIGMSFSLKSERSGGLAQSIGAGIVIGFSYWIVYAFSVSLGRSGTLPPLLAAWTANILFGAGALGLLWRIKT